MKLPTSAALLLVLAARASGDVLIVDDDGGPGVFSDLQAAIDAAAPGDAVLVEPGTYSAFLLEKRLSILGSSAAPTKPVVEGVSVVDGAVSVRLAGLSMAALELRDVSGAAVVESCSTGNEPFAMPDVGVGSTLLVRNSSNVLVVDTLMRGFVGCCGDSPWPEGQVYGAGASGLRCEASDVTVVGCDVSGGNGQSGCEYNTGGSALEVRGGLVTVVGSQLRGGGGGSWECLAYGSGDPGGDAAWVLDGALVIRGSGSVESASGFPVDYTFGGSGGGISTPAPNGFGIRAEGGTVHWSGTALLSESATKGTIVPLAQPEPFLLRSGALESGGVVSFEVRAEAGLPLALLASTGVQPFALDGWEGTFWPSLVDFAGVVAVVGTGLESPVTIDVPLPGNPASFAGAVLALQLFAPTVPGTFEPALALAANPATVLFR